MVKSLIFGAALFSVLGTSREAEAQDKKSVGLVFGVSAGTPFGSPPTVGFDWELSDRVAVQPEIYLLKETLVFGTRPPARDQWSLSAGMRGLFYIRRWDAVRIYASPRVAHIFATGVGPLNTGPIVSGTFGAQYRLSSRISLFAEAGVEYTRLRTTSGNSFAIDNLYGNRQALGAILFF